MIPTYERPGWFPSRYRHVGGLPRPWLLHKESLTESTDRVWVRIAALGSSTKLQPFNYLEPRKFNLDTRRGRERAARYLAGLAVELGKDFAIGPAINIDKTVEKGAPQIVRRANVYGVYADNIDTRNRGYTEPEGEERERVFTQKYQAALESLPHPLGSRTIRALRRGFARY